MTNQNNTALADLNMDDFIKDCSIHSQFCLSVETLLENGSNPEHLKAIVNEMREQSELIESLSRFLMVKEELHCN